MLSFDFWGFHGVAVDVPGIVGLVVIVATIVFGRHWRR
jgi:hypothetical protein